MKILAVDTSTSMAAVAISVDERVVVESLFNTDRTLSARLIPEIMRMLDISGVTMSDVDLFAASIGPGSFTGVRGGVATIQGLALATGKPCSGFSALALLAMNFSLSTHLVCPLIDARKSEVYAALYDCSAPLPVSRLNDCVLPPDALLDKIAALTDERVIFAGDGAVRYRDKITDRLGEQAIFAPSPLNVSRSSNGILLALNACRGGELLEPSQLLPVYLRASDAEINRCSKMLEK